MKMVLYYFKYDRKEEKTGTTMQSVGLDAVDLLEHLDMIAKNYHPNERWYVLRRHIQGVIEQDEQSQQ